MDKSEAFLIYSEFGPSARMPRVQRLKQAFPEQANDELSATIAQFEEVKKSIWKIVEMYRSAGLQKAEFDAAMLREHPFMNATALQRAWSLGGYYYAFS